MDKKEFKERLADKTYCSIQHTGWTCGTCFFSISDDLTNDHWRAVLYFRGGNTLKELDRKRGWDYKTLLNEVWELIK